MHIYANLALFHYLDFQGLLVCHSVGHSAPNGEGINSVAISGGSCDIFTGLLTDFTTYMFTLQTQ